METDPVPTVVLHIGAFKTGTSFIQRTLSENRVALGDQGILVPADPTGSLFHLFRAFWRGRDGPTDPASTSLVTQCRTWEGSHAIVSAERLSLLRPSAVARLVDAFRPHPVVVVLGARDLVRTVPSQWQSFVRGRAESEWTYRDYVTGVAAGPASRIAGRMFWERHDWPELVSRWGAHVGADSVRLVTVPQGRTPPEELWLRFGRAAGFDPSRYPWAAPLNTSLGAQSAEVLRRVNAGLRQSAKAADRSWVDEDHVVRVLARKTLSPRSRDELRVAFPPEYGGWVKDTSGQMLEHLADLSPVVVGDLDELVPVIPRAVPANATTRPDELPTEEILAAARYALHAMRRSPRAEPPLPDGPVEEQLARTIDDLVRAVRRRARRQRSALPGEDSNPY